MASVGPFRPIQPRPPEQPGLGQKYDPDRLMALISSVPHFRASEYMAEALAEGHDLYPENVSIRSPIVTIGGCSGATSPHLPGYTVELFAPSSPSSSFVIDGNFGQASQKTIKEFGMELAETVRSPQCTLTIPWTTSLPDPDDDYNYTTHCFGREEIDVRDVAEIEEHLFMEVYSFYCAINGRDYPESWTVGARWYETHHSNRKIIEDTFEAMCRTIGRAYTAGVAIVNPGLSLTFEGHPNRGKTTQTLLAARILRLLQEKRGILSTMSIDFASLDLYARPISRETVLDISAVMDEKALESIRTFRPRINAHDLPPLLVAETLERLIGDTVNPTSITQWVQGHTGTTRALSLRDCGGFPPDNDDRIARYPWGISSMELISALLSDRILYVCRESDLGRLGVPFVHRHNTYRPSNVSEEAERFANLQTVRDPDRICKFPNQMWKVPLLMSGKLHSTLQALGDEVLDELHLLIFTDALLEQIDRGYASKVRALKTTVASAHRHLKLQHLPDRLKEWRISRGFVNGITILHESMTSKQDGSPLPPPTITLAPGLSSEIAGAREYVAKCGNSPSLYSY